MSPTTLPFYFTQALAGSPPATLSPLQLFAQAHLCAIQGAWWLTYTAVLAYLISRFILLPLLAKRRKA